MVLRKGRLWVCALALCLLLAAPALAEKSGDWMYVLNPDGTAAISGYLGSEGTVTLPSELDGRTVTSVMPFAFTGGNTLTDVTVPGTIRGIGNSAFGSMEKLSRVTFEEGLLEIQESAFATNEGLEEIILPDSLIALGDSAFGHCPNLRSVSLGEELRLVGTNPFVGDVSLARIELPAGNERLGLERGMLMDEQTGRLIGYAPAADEGGGESVLIPEGIREIGEDSFRMNEALRSVTIPEGVEVIGDRAFAECTALLQVAFPDSLRGIGEDAFGGCKGLTELTLPEGLVSLGAYVFVDCENLMSVRMPPSVTDFGEAYFQSTLFYGCEKLTLIVDPGSAAEAFAQENGIEYGYAEQSE